MLLSVSWYECLFLVYRSLGYMNVVHKVAEMSMNSAVDKIKQRPDYAQAGEVYRT